MGINEGRLTRQRDYQLRHVAMGLCTHCRAPSMPIGDKCFRHWLFRKLTRSGMLKGRLGKYLTNKRERLTAHLYGRYAAVRGGYIQAVGIEQALKDAVDIRTRLRITWGGIKGSMKLAKIIMSIERHALTELREFGKDD